MVLSAEISPGRPILSPAIVAANFAPRPRIKRKFCDRSAAISTRPVSLNLWPLERVSTLSVLIHEMGSNNSIFKEIFAVLHLYTPILYFWGVSCTPTLVQKLFYTCSSFPSTPTVHRILSSDVCEQYPVLLKSYSSSLDKQQEILQPLLLPFQTKIKDLKHLQEVLLE